MKTIAALLLLGAVLAGPAAAQETRQPGDYPLTADSLVRPEQQQCRDRLHPVLSHTMLSRTEVLEPYKSRMILGAPRTFDRSSSSSMSLQPIHAPTVKPP